MTTFTRMIRPRIFYAAVGVAVFSMLLFTAALVNHWLGPATGTGAVFCEASRPGLIKQPSNTFSNLGFIVAGLVIAWQLSKGQFSQNHNSITQGWFYGTFFSCLTILLGPGSMAMHATEAASGGFFDMLSMYLVASFTVAYAVERFFDLRPLHFTAVFSAVLGTCIWANFQPYQIVFDFFGNTAFAFFIGVTTVVELLNSTLKKMEHERKWGYLSLGTLLVSLLIWNLWKNDSPLCDPQSWFQGHAIWHLLDALAVYFLFRFYASEHRAVR